MTKAITSDDPRISILQGGDRPWWDVKENKIVSATTIYLPQGCPDWGEKNGKRNQLCTFCMLPNAVIEYRNAFYEGQAVPQKDHVDLFQVTLQIAAPIEKNIHTLMIFNAGSFLATIANAPETQRAIMQEVAIHPTIKRVVIESRAELITDSAVKRLIDILEPANKQLTIRIGVETQDDHLRIKVLRKGHSRKQLYQAVEVMKKYNVTGGGYALLNPAPNLETQWAMQETKATIDWVLGNDQEQLGMDEVYFCSTNVGPGTPLERFWQKGQFQLASLWMVYKVLIDMAQKYQNRVHLLPFKDEPELLAVPSNHVPEGIAQDLTGATGCDRAFHAMLDRYRETRDPAILVPPVCECRPKWL